MNFFRWLLSTDTPEIRFSEPPNSSLHTIVVGILAVAMMLGIILFLNFDL